MEVVSDFMAIHEHLFNEFSSKPRKAKNDF